MPFGKARALPVPEPDGQRHLHLLLPNGSSLLFGADGARLPLAREPPPRAPSHQARLLNRSARMRGRVPSFASPTLISCTSRVAPAVSGKPYLRVGKPTRHLAFGDSLWHDPIQRRTCFLTHLPLLAGSIGVSSHTRPPESSTGAPGRVGDTHPPVTPAPYAAWVTRLLRGFGRAARVLPPAALVRARPRPHLRVRTAAHLHPPRVRRHLQGHRFWSVSPATALRGGRVAAGSAAQAARAIDHQGGQAGAPLASAERPQAHEPWWPPGVTQPNSGV